MDDFPCWEVFTTVECGVVVVLCLCECGGVNFTRNFFFELNFVCVFLCGDM